MKSILLILLMSGCAQSYWVRDPEWRAAEARSVATIEAENDSGDRVKLMVSKLPSAEVTEERTRVRVTPRNPKLRVGWALLGIGAVLAVGTIVAAATANPPHCHDESCFVPQLVAGSTLGALSGVSFIAGAAVAGTAVHDAEAR